LAIKIALPKGRLLSETAALLERAGWGVDGYREGTRFYRFTSRRFADLSAKLFHEKDIPIQVAFGNYDLGICGLDWVEELLVRYPSSALVKVKDTRYGESSLYMAVSRSETAATVEEMQARLGARIASEYPNLSESFAAHHRLKQFKIFPLWGGADGYPPESAELVLISAGAEAELYDRGLASIAKVLDSSAFLIANKDSWETKDLSEVLASIGDNLLAGEKPAAVAGAVGTSTIAAQPPHIDLDEDVVRLALPDGHQQSHTVRLLNKAGIKLDDYPSPTGNRRPKIHLDGVAVKVIRPQDMPLQVANGNFDLAITGRDWLKEHLYQFPSSPVEELLDLKFGKVKIVAVISQELPVSDAFGLRQVATERSAPLRVASEYVNIADKYARDNHLGAYRVIPTWGATEAFLPEDADLLIENTETGSTIARHNLKIIDTLFESTACLIGGTGGELSPVKQARVKPIVEALRTAVERLTRKAEDA